MSLSPARREASSSSFSSKKASPPASAPRRALSSPRVPSRRRRSCFSATALRPNVTRRIRAAWSVSVVASFSRSVDRRSARDEICTSRREVSREVSSRLGSGSAKRSSSAAKRAYCSARQRASARRAPARRCAKARFHSPSARPRSSAEASALNSGSHAATSPYACHGACAVSSAGGANGGGSSAAEVPALEVFLSRPAVVSSPASSASRDAIADPIARRVPRHRAVTEVRSTRVASSRFVRVSRSVPSRLSRREPGWAGPL